MSFTRTTVLPEPRGARKRFQGDDNGWDRRNDVAFRPNPEKRGVWEFKHMVTGRTWSIKMQGFGRAVVMAKKIQNGFDPSYRPPIQVTIRPAGKGGSKEEEVLGVYYGRDMMLSALNGRFTRVRPTTSRFQYKCSDTENRVWVANLEKLA